MYTSGAEVVSGGCREWSNLARMNWRRGILLAGINLAVALGLMVWLERPYWPWIRSRPAEATAAETDQIEQYGDLFNPCLKGGVIDRGESPQELIVGADNLPVTLFTLGHEPCSTPAGIDRILENHFGRTRKSEFISIATFCGGAAIQWLLVGAFPLVRPRRWWLEPGALITVCTVSGAAFAFIPYVSFFSRILAVLIGLAWLWWFGLLVWNGVRLGWKHLRAG